MTPGHFIAEMNVTDLSPVQILQKCKEKINKTSS